jgi:hypothetical protein
VRRGKISAKSEDQARKSIEAMNYQVLKLELFVEGDLKFKASRQNFKGLRFDAPAQTDYIPSFSERASEFFQNESLLWKGVAFFFSVGIIVFALSLSWDGLSASRHKPVPLYQIKIQGQLSRHHLPLDESRQLVVSFPDLPLREPFLASEVTSDEGVYELSLQLKSTRTPRTAEIFIRDTKGQELRSGSFILSGEPLEGRAPKI